MKQSPPWQYDEFMQVGIDYDDPAAVAEYDARHAKFRDVAAECRGILDALNVTPRSVVIELGTGTGAFAIFAARCCAKVYAVDVSQPMLDFAKHKADAAGLENIDFCHGGFLTYEYAGAPADILVTCMALHHLPDFWKSRALIRINRMLKIGGQLYLKDVVFEEDNVIANIEKWLDHLGAIAGPKLRDDVTAHVREEYSTFDWVMDGLLARAGFKILSKEMADGVLCTYLCEKGQEIV